jgi:hypothetical protein
LLAGVEHLPARYWVVAVVLQLVAGEVAGELILSTPGTDNALITLKHASDDELHSVGHQHLSIRQAAIDDEASSRSDDVG